MVSRQIPRYVREDRRVIVSNPMISDQEYINKICTLLQDVERYEYPNMLHAARLIYASLRRGGLLHVFSTGHSHMIVEELFYRAGGLIPVNPILDDSLMLHKGAITSTHNERIAGKATEILSKAGLRKGDSIIISSNTGINTVPVEAAIVAKSLGLTVICVTSLKSSMQLESRHEQRKKLYQESDIVIDNHSPLGDGVMQVPINGQITGGTSTFTSLFIAQRIVLMVENLYLSEGLIPPIFMSANIPGGDEYNEKMAYSYKGLIQALW